MQRGCFLNVCHGNTLLEDGTSVVQEDGHNIFFSLGTAHDSILELAEEEVRN
jgi:hypothetical protein